jgi:serine phosphatase RsbU (regulator of sigma subunit)
MHELWSSASYEPHLLSLPFALAPAAMLIVIAYAAVMRGAPVLRGFLIAHTLALLPYATVVMLSPSIASRALAEALFRFAAASIPLAATLGTAFQIALLGRHRWAAWFVVGNGAVWLCVGWTGDALVDGVQRLAGFWYIHAGRWTWLALVHTLIVTLPGFVALGRAAITAPPSDERRQLRAALVANLVTYAGLSDVALAYGFGVLPLGWLLSGIGCLLVIRALIVEDLLRVRAVDTAAPLLIVYVAAATLLGWVALAELGALPWPITTAALILCFAAVRVGIATIGLVNRGARGGEGPLDRLLAQLVGRARALTDAAAIARLAVDVIELGLGVRATVLLASQSDWGWTQDGERLEDARAPDPLLAAWLVEQRAVFADDVERVPGDLLPLWTALVTAHGARVVIPVGSADELLGVVLAPRLRGAGLGFVQRAAERLAEALLHARLALRAAERARIAREVALAATVQAELLPGPGPHVHGALTAVGSWRPATRCAGDFWTVRPLGSAGAVLIAVGDVTGHGVASAMVTAAAIAACDASVVRRGAGLELPELVAALDAAVRRVGGGELGMTCALAIFDPAAGELRFVSCGHPAPYLCRAADRGIELHALVGRGNPLGTGAAGPRVQRRPLAPGDLVVWYTDGVVDAQDPGGAPFGDRKLQHLLKRLDRLAPVAVHELIQRGVAAHRAGRPPADDETLVVAQLGAAP